MLATTFSPCSKFTHPTAMASRVRNCELLQPTHLSPPDLPLASLDCLNHSPRDRSQPWRFSGVSEVYAQLRRGDGLARGIALR